MASPVVYFNATFFFLNTVLKDVHQFFSIPFNLCLLYIIPMFILSRLCQCKFISFVMFYKKSKSTFYQK